jgi:hypothetical protein
MLHKTLARGSRFRLHNGSPNGTEFEPDTPRYEKYI